MLGYCFKRLLIFIPTLLIICLFTFYININAPGDPVLRLLNMSNAMDVESENGINDKIYIEKRKELGLNLPVFYFSISSQANIELNENNINNNQALNLERWAVESGSPSEIKKLYLALIDVKRFYLTNKDFKALNLLENILNESSWEEVKSKIKKFCELENILEKRESIQSAYDDVLVNENYWRRYIPTITFYGLNNQFHKWFIKLLSGDMGISYIDKRPVMLKLKDAISFTLPLSLMSIVLTFLISVPIGVYSAIKRNSVFDKLIGLLLFILYSIPSFWFASMIMVFLGDPDSPLYASWFEPLGFKEFIPGMPFLEWFQIMFSHIWVPLFCLTYFNIAFVSKQMRGSMIDSFGQDYIRTAYAKGLSHYIVVWKHAFRNSLLPIITILGGLFPFAIGGSIVLEIVFSIPGMGWLTIEALFSRDYPVIIGVVFFSGLLTLIGYLFSDISYVLADPRIRFVKRNVT